MRRLTPGFSSRTARRQPDVGQPGFLQVGLQLVLLLAGQAVGDPRSAFQGLGRLDDRQGIVLDPDPEVGRERPIPAQQAELFWILEI
jgi:hypothetical protein